MNQSLRKVFGTGSSLRIISGKIIVFIALTGTATLLFPGCETLSPVTMKREKTPARIKLNDFSPRWESFAPEDFSGVFYTAAATLEPKLEFRALMADLSDASLEIAVSESGEKGKILSARVSSFVRDSGLAAGINTIPFDPVSARENEERTCVGIVVSRNRIIAPPDRRYGALVFYKRNPENGERRAVILPQGEIGDLGEVENAVGGFGIILEDGKLPGRILSPEKPARHPRSAAGLSADGKILYLLVVDGRIPGSAGATEAETGLILKKMGASSGLNFDGGGSSALALRFPDGKVRTVNTPVHGGIPGRERAVAASLGFGKVKTASGY